MPETDQPKAACRRTRTTATQTDTFSRGDAEGKPAEDAGGPDELVADDAILEEGEAGGYQADDVQPQRWRRRAGRGLLKSRAAPVAPGRRQAGRQLPWKPNGTRRGTLAAAIGPAATSWAS